MNHNVTAPLSVLFLVAAVSAQPNSAIEFYDSTGTNRTVEFGWEGDQTTGKFVVKQESGATGMSLQDGNLQVDGTVTANGGFSGDGSSLTNIPISDNSITTSKIANGAVTDAKIDSVSWSKISGMPAGFADGGTVTSVGAGTGLSNSGTSSEPVLNVEFATSGVDSGTSSKAARADHAHDLADLGGSLPGTKVFANFGNQPITTENALELRTLGGSQAFRINLSTNGTTPDSVDFVFGSGLSWHSVMRLHKEWKLSLMGDVKVVSGLDVVGSTTLQNRLYAHKGITCDSSTLNVSNGASLKIWNGGDCIVNDGGRMFLRKAIGDTSISLDGETGTVCAKGDILANQTLCSSDARFKKDVATIENPIEIVQSLRGVRHHWKNEEFPGRNFHAGSDIGFIAQELQETLPELVGEDAEGYMAVSYGKVTAVLVEALKAQQEQMESDRVLLAAQARRLEALSSRIEELEAAR